LARALVKFDFHLHAKHLDLEHDIMQRIPFQRVYITPAYSERIASSSTVAIVDVSWDLKMLLRLLTMG
jgi:hypothetical protein